MKALIAIPGTHGSTEAMFRVIKERCEKQHRQYYGTAAGARRASTSDRTLSDQLFCATAMRVELDVEDETNIQTQSVLTAMLGGVSMCGRVWWDGCTGWQTSAGNLTVVKRHGKTLLIAVAGVRHGIRWWPFDDVCLDSIKGSRDTLWQADGRIIPTDSTDDASETIQDSFPVVQLEDRWGRHCNVFGGLARIMTWSTERWHPMDTLDDHKGDSQ